MSMTMTMAAGPPRTTAFHSLLLRSFADSDPAEEWQDFVAPKRIPINHPWVSRLSASALTHFDSSGCNSNLVNTHSTETYGPPNAPIRFRIGSGAAGSTGVFSSLCNRYIARHEDKFRIALVRNTSRHSQVALLADVVQITLSQEAHNAAIAVAEGWSTHIGRVFNDHFILIGPVSNPAGLEPGMSLGWNLQKMMSQGRSEYYNQQLFHSNGDGSSTFYKKQQLWSAAGIDTSNARWAKSACVSPHPAVKKAAEENAYILIDRATYLTAKDAGVVPRMRVYVEGGPELLNPCNALLHTKTSGKASRAAADFAHWLMSDEAQDIIRYYGTGWSYAKALFTTATQEEFEDEQRLVGRI